MSTTSLFILTFTSPLSVVGMVKTDQPEHVRDKGTTHCSFSLGSMPPPPLSTHPGPHIPWDNCRHSVFLQDHVLKPQDSFCLELVEGLPRR